MSTVLPETTAKRWDTPEGLRVRGSVVVFGGRGESAETYQRFGSRISADSYRVSAFATDAKARAADLATLIRDDLEHGRLVAPLTLIGSDTGAPRAVEVALILGELVDAVILAGYPVAHPAGATADWQTELAERTTCFLHQRALDADDQIDRGVFAAGLSADEVERDLAALIPPVLAIHGGADTISPIDDVLPVYRSASAEVWVIEGAKHDVLNDGAHRTVAAVIVQYLEGRRTESKAPVARRVD